MSNADVSVHRVARVTMDKVSSTGTNWVEFHFWNEHGEEVLEVTAFHDTDVLDITTRPPE